MLKYRVNKQKDVKAENNKKGINKDENCGELSGDERGRGAMRRHRRGPRGGGRLGEERVCSLSVLIRAEDLEAA